MKRLVPVLFLIFIISCAPVQTSVNPVGLSMPVNTKAIEAPDVKVGDSWTYLQKGKGAGSEQKITIRSKVISIDDAQIAVFEGDAVDKRGIKRFYDRHWNVVNSPIVLSDNDREVKIFDYNRYESFLHFPLWEGKEWDIEHTAVDPFGGKMKSEIKGKGKVIGWESIVTPAGTFSAMKIILNTSFSGIGTIGEQMGIPVASRLPLFGWLFKRPTISMGKFEGKSEYALWYVPELKRVVKFISKSDIRDPDSPSSESKSTEFNSELVSYEIRDLPPDFAKATATPLQEETIIAFTTESKPVEQPLDVKKTLPPNLYFSSQLKDQNNNKILEGGENVSLTVEIDNRGEGAAKSVQVILSGNKALVDYLGEKKVIGDIKSGEKKTVEFKTVLPLQIPTITAELKIEVKEERGYSPSETKMLKVAMKPAVVKETLEIISELDVDVIPERISAGKEKNSFALVVGISKYREKIIPEVKYAKKDADIMARYFESVVGIPKANIKLITDSAVTKSDMEAYIGDWLPRRVNKDSTVFIYYSGHGAPDPQGKEAYIVPYEGHPDFPSKLYPIKNMYESLNKLHAKNVVVMLDSCFSGTGGRSVTSAGARPLVISIENPLLTEGKIMVLAASTGNQISSDYDKVQHGLFTYYLLKGMRGEADADGNGIVELIELYEYVKTNVSEKASIELNRDQMPLLLPQLNIASKRFKMPVAKTK